MQIARDIVIDVFAYRGHIVPRLRGWMQRMTAGGYEVREVRCRHNIDIERNASVDRFLKQDVPTGARHLLMLDADMVPVAATEPILSASGDLVYCGCRGQGGSHGHYGDGDLGCGCVRMSATMLEDMRKADDFRGWFSFGCNVDRTQQTACECHTFRDKARAAGFTSRMVGVIGHTVEAIILPEPKAKAGFVMQWTA